MKLAFAYIRRSSYKQQKNNSVEIQKQHIQEFAKRNNLFVPVELIFIEDVTSAYSKRAAQRKQLMKMSEKMVEMNIPTVIFHDISRMDRTGYSFTIDFYRPMLEKLPELEVYTTDSNKPLDPEDTSIKMNFLLFQHESEVKSERAVGNLTTFLENNETFRPGSKTPYGYNQIKKQKHQQQLEPNENADIVAFIFFLSSWGKSLQKIAIILNEANIPSPKGGTWRSSTVENILKNPVYTGKLTWDIPKRTDGGKKQFVFEDSHPAIINKFQPQLIKLNNQLQKTFGRIDTPFLFLNKVKCRHCNQLLSTQNASTRRNGIKYPYYYYVCKNCGYKVNIQEVHDRFIPLILKRVMELLSRHQIEPQTLSFINQMIDEVENSINSKDQLLKKLEEKLKIARDLKDRELELKILEFIQEHKNSLKEYTICQENLKTTYQLVEKDQFFSRFNEILDHRLGADEIRLIILYFVDYLVLSTDQEPQLHFKSNIFSNLIDKPIG
ncbi:recombinase family protein [Neobacillus sp. PS2-9]|uniref:recombinase family protein n=1 Tax=Neobacillus sp. PS2-9 TaxID=3070676 RepID=UPI0027E0CC8B|nr:recombinase family protein [Neobacillus sp. PS2-9]WML57455.1 recombinase family protein [Neobacillus sp. PS2-9]